MEMLSLEHRRDSATRYRVYVDDQGKRATLLMRFVIDEQPI